MKRAGAFLVVAVVAIVMILAPIAWAADAQGKIKSVDPSGKMVTLDDGTQLMIPPTVKVEKQMLKPGANVKASYEEKDGQKVVTSLMVMPMR
jgi:Cu/Ag efflux protein CusF